MLPSELGCGSGSTGWRRVRDWQAAGVRAKLHERLLNWLSDQAADDWSHASVDSVSVRAKRGARAPAPTRSIALAAANAHDATHLLPLTDAILPINGPRGKPGRPRKRLAKLHADKGDDDPTLRRALRARGIAPRIARWSIESSERLGRHRWVVKRSLAWLLGCRRLGRRYERRADLLQGLLHLARALSCPRCIAPATG